MDLLTNVSSYLQTEIRNLLQRKIYVCLFFDIRIGIMINESELPTS